MELILRLTLFSLFFTSIKYTHTFISALRFVREDGWSNKRRYYLFCYAFVSVSAFLLGTCSFSLNKIQMAISFNLFGLSIFCSAFAPCKFRYFRRGKARIVRKAYFFCAGALMLFVSFLILKSTYSF